MAVQIADKPLYRARYDAYIGGVCAGLADRFELDSIVVRILAVLLAGLTLGLAIVVYLVLWARLPLQPDLGTTPYDVTPESAESTAFGCVDCLPADLDGQVRIPLLARLAVAAGVMLLFLLVAINVSPLVPGTQWWQFWPLVPLMAGLALIVIPVRTRHEALWHALGIVLTSASASILPMSLGIMSWGTVGCAVERLWPLLVAAVGLVGAGVARQNRALVVGGAFCMVAFCLAGITFCVVPGELEALLMRTPTGRFVTIAIVG